MPNVTKSCQKLARVVKNWQKLAKIANVAKNVKSCQKLLKATKSGQKWQKLAKFAKPCKKLPRIQDYNLLTFKIYFKFETTTDPPTHKGKV